MRGLCPVWDQLEEICCAEPGGIPTYTDCEMNTTRSDGSEGDDVHLGSEPAQSSNISDGKSCTNMYMHAAYEHVAGDFALSEMCRRCSSCPDLSEGQGEKQRRRRRTSIEGFCCSDDDDVELAFEKHAELWRQLKIKREDS